MRILRKDLDGTVVLEGTCTEDDNFDQLIGPVSGALIINCREITRLNSVGTKAWFLFFQGLREKGVKITFKECSPAVVRLGNVLFNFIVPDEVESVCVPYICKSCKEESLHVLSKDLALKPGGISPSLPCAKCGSEALLDSDEDELLFLGKRV